MFGNRITFESTKEEDATPLPTATNFPAPQLTHLHVPDGIADKIQLIPSKEQILVMLVPTITTPVPLLFHTHSVSTST